MPSITLDIALFSIFLTTNLIIGLVVGRRIKTLRGYSIGRKDFSTVAITSTILATRISSIFLFVALENIYSPLNGLKPPASSWASLQLSLGYDQLDKTPSYCLSPSLSSCMDNQVSLQSTYRRPTSSC